MLCKSWKTFRCIAPRVECENHYPHVSRSRLAASNPEIADDRRADGRAMSVRKREKRLLTAEFGKGSAFSFLVYESKRWRSHINTLSEPGIRSELDGERSLRASC